MLSINSELNLNVAIIEIFQYFFLNQSNVWQHYCTWNYIKHTDNMH